MKRIISISFLFLSLNGYSQSTDISTFFMSNSRKAEIFYGKLAYKNAIELYERVLDKNPNDISAKTRIAECYVAMNNPTMAIHWYEQVINDPKLDPIHKYKYAQALLATNQYDEARLWYEIYWEEIPDDPRPKSKIDFLNNIDFYRRDSNLYFIQHLSFNSTNSDFGAVNFDDGLVFLSSRDEDLFVKYEESSETDKVSQAPLDVFFTSKKDSVFSVPDKFHSVINSKYHEGPMAFYHNSRKVIFTRNNYLNRKKGVSSDDKIKLKIYVADRDENNNWVNATSFPYDNDEYSIAHPSLSQDDMTLYFASDMPGGYGGSDIYYCLWDGNKWEQPVNLGPGINTAGEEMYPFISKDDHLYFVSDGHGGFGGLDIYRSYRLKSLFGHVENLGFPINTSSDDFSFILDEDERTGYISSNRPGGSGSDDIYGFDIRFLSLVGKVLETRTEIPVGDANVSVYDSIQNSYTQLKSDSEGLFHLDLPLDSKYSIEAVKEGYSPQGSTRVNSFERSFETDTITVYMWKHQLFAEGRAFSNETHELLTGVTVTMDNLTDNKIKSMKTSDDGTYFFILESNKKYQIEAELEDHVTSNFIINTDGLIADTLRNDFVLEEEYLDKSVIFFAFDKSEIRPEAIQPLDYMVNVLKRHSNTYIVVSAHADAQGSKVYNQRLSERRAKSIVAYLRSKGIRNDRITWRGFGEELLINRCSDGVECPEEEHSKNRRGELKIEHVKSETPFKSNEK